jgi:hypothetical protein
MRFSVLKDSIYEKMCHSFKPLAFGRLASQFMWLQVMQHNFIRYTVSRLKGGIWQSPQGFIF